MLGARQAGPHVCVASSFGIHIHWAAPRCSVVAARRVHRYPLVAVDIEDMQPAAAIDRNIRPRACQRSAFIRERSGDRAFRRIPRHYRSRSSPGCSLIVARVHLEVVVQCTIDNVKVFVIVTDQRACPKTSVSEIMYGPANAPIQCESAGFSV